MMLPPEFSLATEPDIERVLERQFLSALREIPSMGWEGPIESGFDLHLVYIDERIDGELPDLGQIPEAVFRDWASEKRKQTNEAFYDALRKCYKVTVANFVSKNVSRTSTAKVGHLADVVDSSNPYSSM